MLLDEMGIADNTIVVYVADQDTFGEHDLRQTGCFMKNRHVCHLLSVIPNVFRLASV